MSTSRPLAALGAAATLGLAIAGGITAATHAADAWRAPQGLGHEHRFPPPPPPLQVSELLARAEVEIGIRSQQLDAWRDFTDAAVAVLEPPYPPKPRSDAASGDEPFKLAIALADDAAVRGRKAEKLKAAVDVLKARLTPEQLQKVVDVEVRLMMPPPPPPPPFHGRYPIPGTMPGPPRNE